MHAALTLSLAHHCLLFANVWPTEFGIFLCVYRSVLVRDTDHIYAPVVDFVAAHGGELMIRYEETDPDMMFGRAESLLYKLPERNHDAHNDHPRPVELDAAPRG